MLDVTIITLNYNSTEFTSSCLKSIAEKTGSSVNYEVIVVDNNSNDTECNKLRALKTDNNVIKVYSSLNLGYAGGFMYGMQYSKPSKNYLVLNNDCVFENNCLSILTDYMDKHSNVGLVTAQMYSSSGNHIHSFTHFQTLPKMIFGVGFLRLFNPKKYPQRKGKYESPLKVDTIAGSFMFFKAEVLSKIGGLDSRYFLYCEEEDASMQTYREGYDVYLVPEAKFTHFEGQSTQQDWSIKREYYISLIQFQQKFFSKATQLIFRLLYSFKVGKKFYKGFRFLSLGWFILLGANPAKSLRYKQTVNLNRLDF